MTSSRDKSITALVSGCRKGDKRDWAELIERVAPVIFSVCYRYRLTREESFDVFGKTSLLLLEHLADIQDEKRVLGYVFRIAFREAAAVKTSSRLFQEAVRQRELEAAVDGTAHRAQQDMEMDQEVRLMAEAFRELPFRCQELLRLLFFEGAGISYRDISHRMNIPVSSIGPTRMRCLEKLRLIMIEKGYEE